MNKGLIALGVGAGIVGIIWKATRSKGVPPDEGGSGVTFLNITGVLKPPTGVGSAWRLAEIIVTVKNETGEAIDREISIAYGNMVDNINNLARVWEREGTSALKISLEPGQSIVLTQPHEFIIPDVDPYVYGTIWNQPAFAIGSTYYFQARDDIGNLSEAISLYR